MLQKGVISASNIKQWEVSKQRRKVRALSVRVHGKEYKVNRKSGPSSWPEKYKRPNNLELKDKKISDINEIEGLDALVDLQILDLDQNQITEIKGFDRLANLQILLLARNRITEMKGLDHLANLQLLHLNYNPITEIKGLGNLTRLNELTLLSTNISGIEIQKLGGFKDKSGGVTNPQAFVAYCRQSVEAVQKTEWLERGAIDRLQKLLKVSTRVKLDMMRGILKLEEADFADKIVDLAATYGFKIDGDYVVIEGADLSGFIANLDKQFADWGNATKTKQGKI